MALDKTPKYVASTTLTEPRRADTAVLSGDLTAAIGRLKAKPEGELQVHGSGTLIRWPRPHSRDLYPVRVRVFLGSARPLNRDGSARDVGVNSCSRELG